MGWASGYIERLQQGETVKFRPRGQSMKGRINSGDLCTVEPLLDQDLSKNQIVLCAVKGRQFLHLISGIRSEQYQISNNRGHVNGWIARRAIYGVLVKIEP